ncbi:uncharacterized protein LOC142168870 [Nicotiana tabacum]|uniref:Uncharacterized protein LOC142168870 n=1 Tax=Nicotiana tabacum TaxID=4097 RepID=A0AC58SME7_TOBAC
MADNESDEIGTPGKGKLGFVDESCVKGMYRGELAEQWEKYNAIILSWIGSTVSNELMSSSVYASNAKRPSVELLKNIRLLQFLMGLNESYGNIRSNILAKRPMITVNEAYAIVTQEESQRTLGVIDTLKDPLTMLAGKGHEFRSKRPGLICDYYGYKGHLKENCYKIAGYPPDFRSKKKGQNTRGRTYVNNATSEEKQALMLPIQGNFFTED